MRTRRWINLLAIAFLVLLLLPGAQPARAVLISEDPQPVLPQAENNLSLSTPSGLMCSFTPEIDPLLSGTTLPDYTGWISKLSGNEPWTAGDHTLTVTTRYSYALFNGTYTAFDLLRDQLLQWYPPEQVQEEAYQIFGVTWKNLILTIEGSQQPGDVVMLTAHFDDAPSTGPAPGADDNASGSATLLEAARVLVGHSFPRTVKIVWFTGEELGLRGSAAYVAAHQTEMSSVQGVINLDMYAYDSDNDHCFEMHVGTVPASDRVGQCFAHAVQAYEPGLRYDYFTTSGVTSSSDHASFWSRGVGAVEIGENFGRSTTPNGCGSIADKNVNYHTPEDTLASINFDTAYPIHRAALAAFFAMASADPYKYYFPLVGQGVP